MTERNRRLAIIPLYSPDMIFDAAREGRAVHFRLSDDCPTDVQVVGRFYDGMNDSFSLVVRHSSFPPVPEGCQIPRLSPLQTEFLP